MRQVHVDWYGQLLCWNGRPCRLKPLDIRRQIRAEIARPLICVSDLNKRSYATRLMSAPFILFVTRGLELKIPTGSACYLNCSNLGGAPRSIWTAGHGKGLKVAAISAGAVPLSAPPRIARSNSCCTFAKNLRPGHIRMPSAGVTELHARVAAYG